jgi:dihydroxynaphthoic acid synthetase
MSYQDIDLTIMSGVARVTINRPEKRNAFRAATLDELIDAFGRIEVDPNVGVIVVTGAGDKAFCAGGDVAWEDASDMAGARELARRTTTLAMLMRNCGKPTIARVNGFAVGGGNELQMICDLTIASDRAIFGQAGPKMGSVPIWWGTQLLPRLVGEKKAREIVFMCYQYTANEAEAMGWINKVVPHEELDNAVNEWCERLLSLSPQALRVAKLSLNQDTDRMWGSVFQGYEMISFIHDTEEFHEGTRAFLEKRQAEFAKYRR